MKKLLLFLLISTCSYATPSWYHNLYAKKTNTYYGFGSADSETKAKQLALSDIASQISVHISSSTKLSMKIIDGKESSLDRFTTKQNSQATLSDYKLLKSEFNNAKYYVALSYENIPSFNKFVSKVKQMKIKTQETKQNSYLSQTLIAKKLKKALGEDIAFKLIRKDKQWYIKYSDVVQVLDKKDFARFFTSSLHVGLEINTNKKNNILYDGMKFFFKIKSKKSGYVSIISVYEDGTVSTLVRNIAVKKNRLENIPDKDFETIPEAGLIYKGIETFDLYVLIYSAEKLRFDSFAYADSELISEEKYKNFDELIEFMDDKEYSTLKVVTKPRM